MLHSAQVPLHGKRPLIVGRDEDPVDPLSADPFDAEFESLIFSVARPALDETLPGIPLRPGPTEGLALPLPCLDTAPARPRTPPASLTGGDLASVRVPRLLVELHLARLTGALTLVRGPLRKLVLLEDGRPVFAISNVSRERFGPRCVRAGLASQAEIDEIASRVGPRGSVGERLIALGLLDPERRAILVAEQVRDILWSAFAWREGPYRFQSGALARRPSVDLDLRVGDLVLEGVRGTATLDRLRQDLPPGLALAPRPDPPLRPRLGPAEEALLDSADGTKTVADLVVLSGMAERDALALLQACRDLRILDEVDRILGGTRRMGFM